MNNKNKKAPVDTIVKVLTVACIVAAMLLVTVLVLAFLGGGSRGDTATTESAVPPEIVATTESTTQATTAQPIETKATVYVKAEVAARAIPSASGEVVYTLHTGESVGFITKNAKGWSKIAYADTVCYVPTKYLSVRKVQTTAPAVSDTEASSPTTSAALPELTSVATDTTAYEEISGRKVIDPDQTLWYLVVVNHTRTMPEGYEPELAYIADSDYELDSRVATYYNQMFEAAASDGVYLTPVSAYRYYSTQESNLNALIEEYMYQYDLSEADARAKAETEILPPGCSEHNLGYAVDICSVDDSFRDSYEYAWLVENAHKYGFIERYTEEKQSITGVIPEPWHWRFVGPVFAPKIKASGLCLEEYLEQNGINY